jgi:hypothetical protein
VDQKNLTLADTKDFKQNSCLFFLEATKSSKTQGKFTVDLENIQTGQTARTNDSGRESRRGERDKIEGLKKILLTEGNLPNQFSNGTVEADSLILLRSSESMLYTSCTHNHAEELLTGGFDGREQVGDSTGPAYNYTQFLQSIQSKGCGVDASLTSKRSEIDTLKVIKANSSEMYETNFLLSCRPFIQKFLSMIIHKKNFEEEPDSNIKYCRILFKLNEKTLNTLECINNLNSYCQNLVISDNSIKIKDTIFQRQNTVKELDFIHLLCDILDMLFDERQFLDVKKLQDEGESFDTPAFTEEFYKNHDSHFFNRVIYKNIEGVDDMEEDENDNTPMEVKVVGYIKKNKEDLLVNSAVITKKIFGLLVTLCKGNSENQNLIFEFLGSYMKYMKYFEESLDLVNSVIKDNRKI